jgi:hypothetical protein
LKAKKQDYSIMWMYSCHLPPFYVKLPNKTKLANIGRVLEVTVCFVG